MITTHLLIAGIKSRYPHVKLFVDPAELPTGASWMDLTDENQHVTIEWRPGQSIGLHINRTEDFCTGPDEIYDTLDALMTRLDIIFTSTN